MQTEVAPKSTADGLSWDFFLYFRNRLGATYAENDLRREGYTVGKTRFSKESRQWSVMTKKVLKIDDIEAVDAYMKALAESNNGSYDGHGVSFV